MVKNTREILIGMSSYLPNDFGDFSYENSEKVSDFLGLQIGTHESLSRYLEDSTVGSAVNDLMCEGILSVDDIKGRAEFDRGMVRRELTDIEISSNEAMDLEELASDFENYVR
jgi:hypothetical protein